jgi:PAS domain S-box-containing protein
MRHPHPPSSPVASLDLSAALPSVVEEIPLGIAVLDLQRRIVLLNRALEALTGFDRQTARKVPCRCILRGDFCLSRCPVRADRLEPGPMCIEGTIINQDRQKIPVRVTFTPIRDRLGRPIGFFEAVEDIRVLRSLAGKSSEAFTFGQIVGRSPQMEQIYRFLPMIAQSDSSVLLTGETGTGKDLVAEAIHHTSARAKGPFIKVNCGALPAALLESELFGHHKGAFTGAVESKPGRFQLAHNGTLFLAETGDLPLPLQVKLLTFLDDRVVHPLGATKGQFCDVRVIAATHRNLERMVREGSFREDLLFRLNVVRLHLPPLRERREDIRLLLDHFLQTFVKRFKKPIQGFSADSLAVLLAFPYPGNVRELKNIVEYASNVCQETHILPAHLPAYLFTLPEPLPAAGAGPAPPPAGGAPDADRAAAERRLIIDAILGSREVRRPEGEAPTEEWPAVERRMIVEAFVSARGRRTKAAEILGWSRGRLYRRMRRHGIAV